MKRGRKPLRRELLSKEEAAVKFDLHYGYKGLTFNSLWGRIQAGESLTRIAKSLEVSPQLFMQVYWPWFEPHVKMSAAERQKSLTRARHEDEAKILAESDPSFADWRAIAQRAKDYGCEVKPYLKKCGSRYSVSRRHVLLNGWLCAFYTLTRSWNPDPIHARLYARVSPSYSKLEGTTHLILRIFCEGWPERFLVISTEKLLRAYPSSNEQKQMRAYIPLAGYSTYSNQSHRFDFYAWEDQWPTKK